MKENIIKYLENTLPQSERTEFERALKQDTTLQQALQFQKEQLEKFKLARFHRQAGALLEQEQAVSKSVFRLAKLEYVALAAGALLFVLKFNSLIGLVDKKEATPAFTETPGKVVSPTDTATSVVVPPAPPEKIVEVKVEPVKVVQPKFKNSAPRRNEQLPSPNVPQSPQPDVIVDNTPNTTVTPTPIPPVTPTPEPSVKVGTGMADGPKFAERIDNLALYESDSSLINKQLQSINCGNFKASFVIEADGSVNDPKLEAGDENCETVILNRISKLPTLPAPMSDGKAVRYRFTYTRK